ncbi:MAG: hypothetical protein ACM3X9_14035 [Bacillota bacterium]
MVAGKTGKLAEQTKQAAKVVADLTNQMTVRLEVAVTSRQNGLERVGDGLKTIWPAPKRFRPPQKNGTPPLRKW